jgi:hypothetical protein
VEQEVFSHVDKVEILWQAYKERMGISEFSHMYFNLSSLITTHTYLGDLELPFSKEEIDIIVANLPNDKSPGPDGFNGESITHI